MTGQTDLCISVVSGNDPIVTLNCLRSLVASLTGHLKVEIHFIDNASPAAWFADSVPSGIFIHKNSIKRGFGANHNSIISTVAATYFLLLNDDTVIPRGTCEALVADAQALPHAGFIGPKLLNSDATIQRSVYRFPSPFTVWSEVFFLNKLLAKIPAFDDYADFDYATQRKVEFVSGAALLVRADMIDQIGVLDEGFFMYGEETDWCQRGAEAGWETYFTPTTCVTHIGGHSSVNNRAEKTVEILRSHSRLLEKHFGLPGLLLYKAGTFFKHLPRMLFRYFQDRTRVQSERDIVLWSLGVLRGPGLSELASQQLSSNVGYRA